MSITIAANATAPKRERERLGHYQLIRSLGSGGSASVYLGEHIYQGTQVAIKMLNSSYTDKDLQQLQNEARFLAYLRHPNIMRVLDYNIDTVYPYLIMEYAAEGTLRRRYPYGTLLPLQDILYYVEQVATALQYIHRLGIVHRDIKPENLLLTRNDRVLLSDFGIAVLKREAKAGSDKVGTALYVAPEQISGRPCVQSDQYSLAAVIYEWLCGEPPFMGETPGLIKQQLYSQAIPLRKRLRRFPVAVDNVIMQALSKKPSERFQSMQEFISTLETAWEVCV